VLHHKHKVTPDGLLQYVYQVLKNIMPEVKIGFGTDAYFADLNRHRPKVSTFDFVSYSINPQVHAFDTRSLLETLEVQADTIKTAKSFVGEKEVYISPVTLRKRGNPDATQAVQTTKDLDIDPRQHTWFTAHWTLRTLKNLSAGNSITFYEAVGQKGIIKENTLSHPAQSEEALLTPLYKVLVAIKAFQPEWIIKCNTDDISKEPFLLENKTGGRLMFITEKNA
jgi:hypothetical protein